MIRPLKTILVTGSLALLIGASFAGGQRLRQSVVSPVRTQLTSLPELGIAGPLGASSVFEQGDDSSPAETFQDVYRYVKSEYVDRVSNDRKLSFGAVRTMIMSLDDPKTRFIEPDQLKTVTNQMDGQFTGIGAAVTIVKQKRGTVDQRRLAIVAPAPGGPADKAGVRAGDVVTYVDGKWVIAYDPRLDLDKMHAKDMDDAQYRKALVGAVKRLQDGISLPKALESVTAKDGKTMELTLERAGVAEPIKVKVTTATTKVAPVEFKAVNEHVGYLRVTQFNAEAEKEVAQALAGISQKALVVDLRDNSGGMILGTRPLPDAAIALLARVTSGGEVGSLVRGKGGADPIRIDKAEGPKFKVAVLINGGTANVAELVASAMKAKGATLVGSKTFGDPILQRLVPLRDGAAMTMSAGKYLAANGKEFSGTGIQPDVVVATGGPQTGSDAAFQRAVSALAGA